MQNGEMTQSCMEVTPSSTQKLSLRQWWKTVVGGGVLLALLLLLGSPTSALADTFEGIEITSSAGTVTGVTYNSPVSKMINITNNTDTLTVTGASTQQQQCLTVNPGAGQTARLVLDGLTLNPMQYAFNAITVLSGTLELTIAPGSTNFLNSSMNAPAGGIVCLNGANLTIQGTGSLTASGWYSPAIGAGAYSVDPTLYPGASAATGNAGDILIKEASITASTINGGQTAVIGSAFVQSSNSNYSINSITIENATINATTASGGATIGGGYVTSGDNSNASVGSITIQDATITTPLNVNYAGGAVIGAGQIYAGANNDVSVGTITIDNSTLTLTSHGSGGGGGGALVGAGHVDTGISGPADVSVGDIVMTNTTLTGIMRGGGSYVGAGRNRTAITGVTAAAGDITLVDCTVQYDANNMWHNYPGACIGGGENATAGNITITGGSYTLAHGTSVGGAVIGAGGTSVDGADASVQDITISQASMTLTASQGAGIGAGGTMTNGLATADNILIESGDITIKGNSANGSGIGAGSAYVQWTNGGNASATSVTIAGGTIAIGENMGSGSGIGGGYANSSSPGSTAKVDSITITGGVVAINMTSSPAFGSAIGGGQRGSSGYGDASVGSLTITGGTVYASISDLTYAVDIGGGWDDRSPIGSITITGGSVHSAHGAASVSPQPTNGSEDVYLNVLTVGDPPAGANLQIDDGSINGVACTFATNPTPPAYGINELYTDVSSIIYPWLPEASDEESVIMKIGSDNYVNVFKRPAGTVTETLEETDLTAPAAFIDPDGSTNPDSPHVLNTHDFIITGIDQQAIGPLKLHYYLDGDVSAETTVTGASANVSIPEGRHSITYWASDDTRMEAPITKYFLVDTTKPVTTPSQPGGNYTQVLSLTLTALDPNGANGSGIHQTWYSLEMDGKILVQAALPQTLYTGQAIELTSSGAYTLKFYSTDNAGNVEDVQTAVYTLQLPSGGGGGGSGGGGGGTLPATGDSTAPPLVSLLCALAAAGLLALAGALSSVLRRKLVPSL